MDAAFKLCPLPLAALIPPPQWWIRGIRSTFICMDHYLQRACQVSDWPAFWKVLVMTLNESLETDAEGNRLAGLFPQPLPHIQTRPLDIINKQTFSVKIDVLFLKLLYCSFIPFLFVYNSPCL